MNRYYHRMFLFLFEVGALVDGQGRRLESTLPLGQAWPNDAK